MNSLIIKFSSNGRLKVKDNGVLIESALGSFLLEGQEVKELANVLCKLIDGKKTVDAVIESVAEARRPNLQAFINILLKQDVLEEFNETLSVEDHEYYAKRFQSQRFFWQIFEGENSNDFERRLKNAKILILGTENWCLSVSVELAAAGFTNISLAHDGIVTPLDIYYFRFFQRSDLGKSRLKVVKDLLSNDYPWCRFVPLALREMYNYLDSNLYQWDLVVVAIPLQQLKIHRKLSHLINKNKYTVLYGTLNSGYAIVGPLTIPGTSFCYNCFLTRFASNHNISFTEQTPLEVTVQNDLASVNLAFSVPMLGQIFALEVIKYITEFSSSGLRNQILLVDLTVLDLKFHHFVSLPNCRSCAGQHNDFQNIEETIGNNENDALKTIIKSCKEWIDPQVGIISKLVVDTEISQYPNSPKCAYAHYHLIRNIAENQEFKRPEISGGKGITRDEALVGALGEAFERYSAATFDINCFTYCKKEQLTGEVLDPIQLGLYKDHQYEQSNFPYQKYAPFIPHYWLKANWLHSGQPVWVPALLTYCNYPLGKEKNYCQSNTNGLAAGSNFHDAVQRGAYELIERDAFMVTWLKRSPLSRLILDSSIDLHSMNIVNDMLNYGINVEIFYIKQPHSIPVFLAVGLGDGKSWPSVSLGAAAHLNPQRAVSGAIQELGFTMKNLRKFKEQGVYCPVVAKEVSSFLEHGLYYFSKKSIIHLEFLLRGGEAPVTMTEIQNSLAFNTENLIEILAKKNIFLAGVDITSPDISKGPFTVVRILSPNLLPIHCGYGRERLNHQRIRAINESELNFEIHPFS